MKNTKQQLKNKLILISIGIILLSAVTFLFIVNNQQKKSELITYHSKFLKITIDYPAEYQLEERFGTITLKNNKGEIIVDRIGTNYETIDGYLQDLGEKNRLLIIDKENKRINNQDTSVATLKGYKDFERSYFFYPYKWVIYTIATKNKILYPNLDRVASSFRYVP